MRFLCMATLVVMGAIFAGCARFDENLQKDNCNGAVTLTLCFSDEEGTKALTAAGVKTFAPDDQIAVVYEDEYDKTRKVLSSALVAEDIHNEGKNANFTVNFSEGTPKNNGKVRYIYPANMARVTISDDVSVDDDTFTINFDKLNTQDGSLTTLGNSLDLCTFDGNFSASGELPASATLTNQLAILALTLKDGKGTVATTDDEDITSGITNVTVTDGTYNYTVNRLAGAGPIFVAIRPTNTAIIDVTATNGTKLYFKSLTGKTYAKSNGYNVSWLMTDMLAIPLTMKAVSPGEIEIQSPKIGMKYKKNNDAIVTIDSDANVYIDVDFGDRVAFYGNGTSITSYQFTKITGGTSLVDVYGNIMSLVNEEGFATATGLTSSNAFNELFKGNLNLCDASGLQLPATTLTTSCYESLFEGCTSLTAAPKLPATILAEDCYSSMFAGCTSLSIAPSLPAETLAEGCYSGMFVDCTYLTSVPTTLPATILQEYCYLQMFSGCISLTVAPTLPAPDLVIGCYVEMFYECESLESVTCLATATSDDYTSEWLKYVAVSGTFTTPSTTVWEYPSENGIPDGWTRVNSD